MIRVFARRAGSALLLASLPTIYADATVRYHTDVQTAGLIPAAALDQALGGMRDMVLQIKGNKAYSSQGSLTSIVDLKTQKFTVIDAAHKRFATVPVSQYMQQAAAIAPAIPDQQKAALAAMKTNLESRNTGRTAAIQGIESEEHEFVLTISMGQPGGPSTGPAFMKMIIQMWTAKPEEVRRVPALQEIRNYTASASSTMNPVETIKQVLSGLPGMGESLGAVIKEASTSNAMTMRVHMEVVMPFLALMSQQAPPQAGGQPPPAGVDPNGQLPTGIDPNAPLMQMTQEVVGLSTDPLEESVFEIPGDYEKASLEEVMKGAVTTSTPPTFRQ